MSNTPFGACIAIKGRPFRAQLIHTCPASTSKRRSPASTTKFAPNPKWCAANVDAKLVGQDRPTVNCSPARPSIDANFTGRLEIGDVITQVDGNPVVTVRDYQRAMDAAVQRGGRVELMSAPTSTAAESKSG